MKKKIISFLLTLSAFIGISTSCSPGYEQIFTVGDTWNYYDDLAITLNSSKDYVDSTNSMLFLELTFTINTTSEYQIKEDDVYVFVVVDQNIYSEIDKNIDSNGFNLFDTLIREEIEYTFYFNISLDNFMDENNYIKNGNKRIVSVINPANFHIYIELQI